MTLQEIKQEIFAGPLADEIKPFLKMVFNDEEPLRSKLLYRQGMIIPDAAYGIWNILNDSTKRPKIIPHYEVLKNELTNNIGFLPAVKQKYWGLMIDLINENQDLFPIIEMAIADGIFSEQQKDKIFIENKIATQSRLDELRCSVTTDDIQKSLVVK